MINFEKCFEILTGYRPFAWQNNIYKRFLNDEIPSSCDIPTGLGKTSIIVIWLLSLASKLIENPQTNKIPRRLVYVVDRRVIVDQATSEAERILFKLKEFETVGDEDLRNIFTALQKVSFFADHHKDDKEIDVIALSTLRGEYADNREWLLDPSRPAIIVGTIDMIGSRLLFSAYGGVGESYKALQAGLLGQDSLIVIDEAHLSPAFMEMLQPLKSLVNYKKNIKRFEIMSLSATHLINEKDGLFTLEKDAPEDLTNPVAKARLNAEKHLEWQSFPVSEEILKSKKSIELLCDEQARKMAEAAAEYKDSTASILVFGATVNLVKKIKKELLETHAVEEHRVKVMVGGMRGFERDNLVNDEVFKQFDPKRKREKQDKSYFLIATSCAEVGVNLDADFAVCDVSSADSFIQRLGRVNRFGCNSAKITIVHPENLEELDHVANEAKATFRKLQKYTKLNASPLNLRKIEFSAECYPPKPVSPPLDKARIDDWSMTSLKQEEFCRPLVSYWLRGVTENTSTETSLCWRADLKFADTDRRKIAAVKTVRVKSRECARESTARAEKTILALAARFPDERVVLISAGNDYEVFSLGELASLKKQSGKNELFPKLMFATVVLPCEVGGLENGIVVDELPKKNEPVSDVVDEDEWQRVVFTERENGVERSVIGGETEFIESEDVGQLTEKLIKNFAGNNLRCIKRITMKLSSENNEAVDEVIPKKRVIAYFVNKKSAEFYLPNEAESDGSTESESASIALGEISIETHNKDVSMFARALAEKLNLERKLIEALEIAGAWHDKGKARECWQKAVGNFDFPKKILAKSNQNWFDHKYNNYYRHEFGSLVEAEEDEEIKKHPLRDLILHLIASHHGYARPHFPECAFDRENPKGANFEVATRAMLRFANLQIKYGWWQLAYLEAILKAADALASRAEARGEKI
jgi:CRISPR-associated endonuclease/helicase Cas3